MAKKLVFPALHPGGALLAAGEKLIFELTTNSGAPIFSFKVDAQLVHDASTAPSTSVGGLNKFRWEHPTNVPKSGEVDFIDIAITIVDVETYNYKISKKPAQGKATLLLHLEFAGPEVVLRDTFNAVVA